MRVEDVVDQLERAFFRGEVGVVDDLGGGCGGEVGSRRGRGAAGGEGAGVDGGCTVGWVG